MRIFMIVIFLAFASLKAAAGDVVIQKAQGDVRARQGVAEVWNTVSVGDVLRPNDTMKTGKRSSAVLLARVEGKPDKRISLPADVIVDISDIRELTQEELMLKLTMEKVRSSSYEWKTNELQMPNATVVHGQDRRSTEPLSENHTEVGMLQWNGTRVLLDNGFYSTGVLRAMEVFRMYPGISSAVSNRLLFAEALEKAQLRGEAVAEYGSIAGMPGLTAAQQSHVQVRLAALRK